MRWTTCDRSSSESLFDRGFRSACVQLILGGDHEKRSTFPYRLCLEIHHFHGGALHYHYPCHGAVQHGGYVFVGCLGDTAQVAAVSVVGPVFSILSAVATMLGAGSSAIIARCFGAGEIEQGKTCSSLCFWSSFFLGVLVSIGLLVSRVPLLGVLGSNAEFFPMQSGIFRSLHWVRRFLSCPTAWRCWCVQRAQ